MTDHELAALEHANYITAISLPGEILPNTLVRRANGVAVALSGLQLRLFNQILVEDDGVERDAIAGGVAAARARGADFVVSLRRGIDDRWIPLMTELGLEPVGQEHSVPGMALRPIPAGADDEPLAIDGARTAAVDGRSGAVLGPLDIRVVTDHPGLEDHIAVVIAGFELPEQIVRAFMSPRLLELPGITTYVGYAEGRPVTTGLGIRTGRTIGVYNIATVPEARRRGYGAAMTARVARDGALAGCETAILQASPMGKPIYERMGYRTVVEYDGFVDPEAPAPSADRP
jgi:GNAT superfamily N-acetyltransferase